MALYRSLQSRRVPTSRRLLALGGAAAVVFAWCVATPTTTPSGQTGDGTSRAVSANGISIVLSTLAPDRGYVIGARAEATLGIAPTPPEIAALGGLGLLAVVRRRRPANRVHSLR